MWVMALPVPQSNRIAIGHCMRAARAVSGLKLDSIGHLMGELSAEAVSQMERGERELQPARLLSMKVDPDGKRYAEAFLHAFADLCEVEELDRLVAALLKLCAPVAARMAKATLGNSESERRIA